MSESVFQRLMEEQVKPWVEKMNQKVGPKAEPPKVGPPKVGPPKAEPAKPESKLPEILIHVRADVPVRQSPYAISGKPVTLAEARDMLVAQVKEHPELTVTISADKRARYILVDAAVIACREAGVRNLHLVAADTEGTESPEVTPVKPLSELEALPDTLPHESVPVKLMAPEVKKKPAGSVKPAAVKVQAWTCSMHPQVRKPEPGKCPVCGMDLIPVRTREEPVAPPPPPTAKPGPDAETQVEKSLDNF